MNVRVAAVDIGTNSVLLTIALRADGDVVPIVERAIITRLGRGVDRTGELDPEAVDRTLQCLRHYAELVQTAGVERLDVVGTSALRDARGGEAFCSTAESVLGVRPRIISGDEEARLTFAGSVAGLDARGDVTVVDIGGGSTEIIHGHVGEQITTNAAVSLNVGSVRLFERWVRQDPPTRAELEAVRADVHRALDAAPPPVPGATLVGVAGTVTTLLAIHRQLSVYDPIAVHNHPLDQHTLNRLASRLAALPLAQRQALPGLEPARADVIVVGAIILSEILVWAGASELLVSDRGVRWGLLHDLLSGTDDAR